MDGLKNIFLVRVLRKGVPGPGILKFMPGDTMVVTCCSGVDDAKAYIKTERDAGPCRVWIAALGDIPETRFVEQEA